MLFQYGGGQSAGAAATLSSRFHNNATQVFFLTANAAIDMQVTDWDDLAAGDSSTNHVLTIHKGLYVVRSHLTLSNQGGDGSFSVALKNHAGVVFQEYFYLLQISMSDYTYETTFVYKASGDDTLQVLFSSSGSIANLEGVTRHSTLELVKIA